MVVQEEIFYKSEAGVRKTFVKSKRSIKNSKIEDVDTVVKPPKLRDVKKVLVKHFEPDCNAEDRLFFCKNILAPAAQEVESRNDEEEDSVEHGWTLRTKFLRLLKTMRPLKFDILYSMIFV